MANKVKKDKKIVKRQLSLREELREEPKRWTVAIVKQMLTLATSGFGLVAALAWNSVIQELVTDYVKKLLPNGSGLISLFLYALVVTVLAVSVTLQLSRVLQRLEKKASKKEKRNKT